jgi:hypothetical protein
MPGQGFKTSDNKAQQPFEPDAHRAANAAKRETFQQQALNELTRFIRDQVLLEAIDKLTATLFALMVLLGDMQRGQTSRMVIPMVSSRC